MTKSIKIIDELDRNIDLKTGLFSKYRK